MSAIELNRGLALASPKQGEVRNPIGKNGGVGHYRRNREIRAALYAGLNSSCDLQGEENKTFFDVGIRSLLRLWAEGDRWACTFITNRVWGRVPLDIEVRAELRMEQPDIEQFTEAQLLERLDLLRSVITEQTPLPVEPQNAKVEVVDADWEHER